MYFRKKLSVELSKQFLVSDPSIPPGVSSEIQPNVLSENFLGVPLGFSLEFPTRIISRFFFPSEISTKISLLLPGIPAKAFRGFHREFVLCFFKKFLLLFFQKNSSAFSIGYSPRMPSENPPELSSKGVYTGSLVSSLISSEVPPGIASGLL